MSGKFGGGCRDCCPTINGVTLENFSDVQHSSYPRPFFSRLPSTGKRPKPFNNGGACPNIYDSGSLRAFP